MEDKQFTSAEAPETEETKGKKGKPKKGWKRELLEWIASLAVALVLVFLITNFLFTLIKVDGHSMDTTLSDGERLFVSVLDTRFADSVPRNSVVICHYPNRGRTYFVKRCVAVPGDTLYREGGVTYVEYQTTAEDGTTQYVRESLGATQGSFDNYGPYVLGEDEYFMVGDNRNNSHDSRNWNDAYTQDDVGPITKDMIVGRVRCVFWPLNAIRTVE